MSVRTNAIQLCDRCLKPFTEKNLKAGDEVPVFKQHGLTVVSTNGSTAESEVSQKVLFSFDDLCPDCDSAVTNLLAKIRLDAVGDGGNVPRFGVGGTPAKRKPRKSKSNPTLENGSGEGEYRETGVLDQGGSPVGETPVSPENSEVSAASIPVNLGEEVPSEKGSMPTDQNSLVEDPETGDVYDPATGEVLKRGQGAGSEHPF